MAVATSKKTTKSKSPKYDWRLYLKVRGGRIMTVPAETKADAIVFLETLQREYGNETILQQRAAGKWVKATEGPVAMHHGTETRGPTGKTGRRTVTR
jgi:hypothetical protein